VTFFDCIMFNDELDMLEFRLTEMQDYPDVRHVLVESVQTHQGEPKPLHYRENMDRFVRWQRRIVYYPASYSPASSPWVREQRQRDTAWYALTRAEPEDMVLVSDVDEIPSRVVLAPNPPYVSALQQRVFHSAVDWEYPEPQRTSVLACVGHLKAIPGQSLSTLRSQRDFFPVLENAGWHFSWLGTAEQRQAKLLTTCHTDMPEAEWNAIADGTTWSRGLHYASDSHVRPADVDDTWPAYIRERRCPPSWFRPRGSL
jgi:hypothetical protein